MTRLRQRASPRRIGAVPWWRQLRWRLAAIIVIALAGMGAGLTVWVESGRARDRDASLQRESALLARYIVQRRAESTATARANAGRPDDGDARTLALRLKEGTGMYVREINPALEVYLLDSAGRISDDTLDHPPRLTRVDLAPLQAFLRGDPLPLYGDDPRLGKGATNLFSVAPIDIGDDAQAYLYVILRGEKSRQLVRSADRAQQLRLSAGIAILSASAAALLIALVQRLVTRRLLTLHDAVLRFRPESDAVHTHTDQPWSLGTAEHPGDEIDHLSVAMTAMQTRIDQQFGRLQQADRMRAELIGNISHDLHTPLASLQGFLETLLLAGDGLGTEQRQAHLQTMLKQCQRMTRRVKELFELSKLESGQVHASLEPFNLVELLGDIAQGYAGSARADGVAITLDPGSDLDAQVRADIRLIERVLQNLIDNALRHTPSGGRITLSVRTDGDRVRVRVCDTGCGIAPEDLPYIFERYWTRQRPDDGQHHRPGASSGLGLAIVRKILSLHDSDIEVHSQLTRGTEFAFALCRG